MQKGEGANLESRNDDDAVAHPSRPGGMSPRDYKNRILLAGFLILALSFLAGIVLSFYRWENGSAFDLSNWGSYNPVGRATYAPLTIALFLFPFTLHALFILWVPIYFGMIRKRLWPLSLFGFLSIGLLWLSFISVLWEIRETMD